MAKKAATEIVGSRETVFAVAKTKARCGNKTWLIFARRDGKFEARPYSALAIKAALLAGGSKTRFSWFDGRHSHICRSFGYGIHLWRCAKGHEKLAAA